MLGTFYGVPSTSTPLFLIAFAAGNLIGPLAIGHLFDTIGRKTMIASTYITSGVLLGITAFLFNAGLLTALTQTFAWCVIFFFASSGASATYLDGQRDLPARGAGKSDSGVLRHCAMFRRAWSGHLRNAHR